MGGIEGHAGVTNRCKSASRRGKCGRARQKPVRPGDTIVAGGSPADISAPSTRNTSYLEYRNDSGAEREIIGLYFGAVLAGGIGEGIATELNQRGCGVGSARMPEQGSCKSYEERKGNKQSCA